jgi:hypothetical protein
MKCFYKLCTFQEANMCICDTLVIVGTECTSWILDKSYKKQLEFDFNAEET